MTEDKKLTGGVVEIDDSVGRLEVAFNLPGQAEPVVVPVDSCEVIAHLRRLDDECGEDEVTRIARLKDLIKHLGGPESVSAASALKFYALVCRHVEGLGDFFGPTSSLAPSTALTS